MLLEAYLVGLRCTLPVALRALPLPAVFRLLTPHRVSVSRERATQAVERSEAVARRLRVPDTCLYRAMTRWAALRRAGVPVRFAMGIRRDKPETGHAWIELDGSPLGEAADARLIATFCFPEE